MLQTIDDELHQQRLVHWSALQSALAGERYAALLADLQSWVDHPPATKKATRPGPLLVRMAQVADQQVTRRLKHANRSGDIEELHRARKAAKRARYAAEVAAPITGNLAVKEARRYERLQDLLGEHQDSVVSAKLLRQLGATAGAAGFTFGLLYEREQQRARQTRTEARRIAKRYR